MDKNLDDLMKALKCLRLEVPEEVAKDVENKARAYVAGVVLDLRTIDNANQYIREQYTIKELQCHKLGIALREAAQIFQTYAQHHRDKGNVEKANANQAAAEMCDRAVL